MKSKKSPGKTKELLPKSSASAVFATYLSRTQYTSCDHIVAVPASASGVVEASRRNNHKRKIIGTDSILTQQIMIILRLYNRAG